LPSYTERDTRDDGGQMPRYDRIELGSWGRQLLDEDIERLADADYGGDRAKAEEAHYAMTGGQAHLQMYVGGLMTGDPRVRMPQVRLTQVRRPQ
jgi:hypothetical protein